MILVYRFLKSLLVSFFFILATYGGIKSAVAQTKNIELNVSFRSKIPENFDINKFRLNHPIKISIREVVNHLVSLKYKGTSLGSKEESAFLPVEIKKLAPILVKAFARVGPRKIIHIELKSKTGTTVADIFSFRNYLSWRFESIHGQTFFQKNNARAWNIFAWELIPQKGQLYYKSSSNKRLHKNWMVAKLQLPVAETKEGASMESSDFIESGNSGKQMNPDLEVKLRQLKHLYEQGLIEEEEYKIQQKNLFEKLF